MIAAENAGMQHAPANGARGQRTYKRRIQLCRAAARKASEGLPDVLRVTVTGSSINQESQEMYVRKSHSRQDDKIYHPELKSKPGREDCCNFDWLFGSRKSAHFSDIKVSAPINPEP